MPISHYLKIIARGAQGARHLSREHACDLFGQVLDGSISDLEVGAFCIAMRVKGETPEEMAGFLDAVHCCWRGRACRCWCTAPPPKTAEFLAKMCLQRLMYRCFKLFKP